MPEDEPTGEAGSDHGRTRPRRRWAGLPAAISWLAESYLRDSMIIGTATLALLVAVGGLLSGSAGQAVTGVVVGVGGAVLLIATVARRRPLARQWLAIAVVLVAEIALIAAWTA